MIFLITGGSSGLGYSLVDFLSKNGVMNFLVKKNMQKELQKLKEPLEVDKLDS